MCRRCQVEKSVDDFYSRPRAVGRAYDPDCKACRGVASKERWAKHGKRYNASARGKRLAEKYGIDEVEYQQLLRAQGNRCAICGADFTEVTPHVDHCHSVGSVRGVLCPACNLGLGQFRDEPDRLEAAARYLRSRVLAAPAGTMR